MKKTIGYFYRKSGESISQALQLYSHVHLHRTKKEAEVEFRKDRKTGLVGSRTKPVFCKVVVEEVKK